MDIFLISASIISSEDISNRGAECKKARKKITNQETKTRVGQIIVKLPLLKNVYMI